MVPLPPLRDGARALPISSFRQSMPSFDTRCPGLHLQPGASVVLGCVGELPGSRCTDFNPRAPCGTRRDRRAARCALHRISIHAPRVGRDALAPGVFTEGYISIHAPRVGRDYIDREAAIEICISIHAPRVGRDCAATITRCWRQISIHAPRVGRDQELTPDAHRTSISIHAPRVGRDCILSIRKTLLSYFNPRAPCGTRRALVILVDCALQISIHAPRVGRDLASSAGAIVPERFQSTRPVWGATAPPSILAP